MMFRNLFTSIIIILSVSSIQAQEWINCTHGEQINTIKSYGNEIWLGTTGGILRYNEYTGEKTYFNRSNANIPSNNITSIVKDNQDRVWVSTRPFYNSPEKITYYQDDQWYTVDTIAGLLSTDNNGNLIVVSMSQLHILDGTSFTTIEIETMNHCPIPTGVAINPLNNDIWMSFYGFGCFSILKYDGTTFEKFDHSNSPLAFESPINNPIFIDHTGKVWIGSWDKVYTYDGQEWETIDEANIGYTKGLVTSMDQFNTDKIWFGISNSQTNDTINKIGLLHYDGQNWGQIQLPIKNKFSNNINAILIRENDLLIGSDVGFMIYDFESFKHISSSNSKLKTNSINSLLYNGDDIWYASGWTRDSSYNKVTKINNGNWFDFTIQNSPLDPTKSTQLLTKDKEGTIYVKNGELIYYYKDNNWTKYEIPDLLEDIVESNSMIRFDNENNPWLFHYYGYIFRHDGTNWITIDPEEHGNLTGYYNGISFDPTTNDLWFANYNSLYHYDGSEWESFNYFDIPAFGNNIRSLAIDSAGLLWIVGGFGISSYDGSSFTGYTNYDIGLPISNNNYSCLTIDQSGNLWVAGFNMLLNYDGINWDIYTTENIGLPDQRINTLISDKYNNIWIGTEASGLGIFNTDKIQGIDVHTGVKEFNKIEKLKVFPSLLTNGGSLTIIQPEITSNNNIIISDIHGNILMNRLISNHRSNILIELNDIRLKPGCYFIQLYSDQNRYVGKFIIVGD